MTANQRSDRLLSPREVERMIGYTRQHLSRLERRGTFPQRLQLGGNKVAWKLSEVEAWIEARPRGPLSLRGEQPAPEAA